MKGVKKIGEILVEKGFLRGDFVAEALASARLGGVRLGESCLMRGLITEDQLAAALAEQYGLPVADMENTAVNEEVCNLIPAETLHRFGVMPVVSNGAAYLLTADPTDVVALDNIERMIEERGARPGKVAVAPAGDIERLFNRGTGPVRILKEAAGGFDDSGIPESEIGATLTLEKIAVGDSPVVKLVDTIIYDAIAKRASDIHLETDAAGLSVKFRIDGALHKVMEPIDKKHQPSIISRIKVMSELDISERRVPQDGRFRIRFKKKTIDFRVSIMPAVYGEDAVIRILDKEHLTSEFEKLTLSSLGFGEKEVFLLRRMIKEPYGMLLVTGPTGSGKTTSLYAALSEINTGDDKIITIEDPVEYELKG
ncbi:MAG: Flp pilus assembly complex ATPase component TadA, partial [Deltaproteobacteria bacterium]|nr:Flp pilus assembly complex ATPase component TadA [Deltaproteobacteria bacterium]